MFTPNKLESSCSLKETTSKKFNEKWLDFKSNLNVWEFFVDKCWTLQRFSNSDISCEMMNEFLGILMKSISKYFVCLSKI